MVQQSKELLHIHTHKASDRLTNNTYTRTPQNSFINGMKKILVLTYFSVGEFIKKLQLQRLQELYAVQKIRHDANVHL